MAGGQRGQEAQIGDMVTGAAEGALPTRQGRSGARGESGSSKEVIIIIGIIIIYTNFVTKLGV